MKTFLSLKSMFLGCAIILALGWLSTGCSSNSQSGSASGSGKWDGRIGNYTYTQATAEYGSPIDSHKLSNGGTTAEWLTRRNAINPNPPGTATQIREGGIDQPTGSNVNTFKNEYLRLSFDESGKLTKWDRVYR